MKKILDKSSNYLYLVFRVIIGFLFLLHGIMKMQGIASGKIAVFSLFYFPAFIETIGGAFIILGLFTRIVSLISAVEMIFAYMLVHVPSKGWNPLVNMGEPVVLYFVSFLVLLVYGGKFFCLDNLLHKKQ